MHKEHVYIGVGSNLGNSQEKAQRAFDAISQLEDTRVLKTSSLYSSCLLYTSPSPRDRG